MKSQKTFLEIRAECRGLRAAHKKIKAERDYVSVRLSEAIRYLQMAKIQFAPTTTNSLVDDFIKRTEAYSDQTGQDQRT